MTPVQMVAAFSAIANGGWLLRPRLVDRMVTGNVEHAFKAERRRRVFSQQTANRLTAILVGVVERGTGAQAALDGYLVAASPVPRRRPRTAATATARSWSPSSATRRPRRRAS